MEEVVLIKSLQRRFKATLLDPKGAVVLASGAREEARGCGGADRKRVIIGGGHLDTQREVNLK